jgi:hypothetical protein
MGTLPHPDDNFGVGGQHVATIVNGKEIDHVNYYYYSLVNTRVRLSTLQVGRNAEAAFAPHVTATRCGLPRRDA